MTPPEPRLCLCGCLEPIVRRPGEKLVRFKAREYASRSHADAHRSLQGALKLDDRNCETCGKSFGRRHYKSGRLEGTRDFELRRFCPDHTSPKNGGAPRPAKPPITLSPFNPATRLPDPRPLQTLADNPKNESNMKRPPSLLEAERASGFTLEPVPIEQFECAARRAKRLHPDFAAMLKGQEVREPVAGEVTV